MKPAKKSLKEKLQRRFARNRKKRGIIENIVLASFSILFLLPLIFYATR
jgi:hypothetical protein